MSIRTKMILSIVAVFAIGAFTVAQFMHQSYGKSLDQAAAAAIAQGATMFRQAEIADTAKLSSANVALQQNDAFRDAYTEGDREKLFSLTRDVFSGLKSEFAITHWYFERPAADGTVFLRVHKPEQFDDALKRKTYLEASSAETVSAGLELGATAVALRVVRPYYSADGSSLIGYTETGQEIDSILDAVKEQTGDTVGLMLSKKSMDASSWAAVRESKGLEDNWGDQADLVLAASTDDAASSRMVYAGDFTSVPDDGEVIGSYSEDGKNSVRGVFPVKDAVGETIGLVYMDHDITAQAKQLHDTQRKVVAVVIAGMIAVLLTVIMLMNSLVFRRLNAMIEHMKSVSTQVAGGEYDVKYEKTGATDEIGRFEDFFANFISLVGSAMKQLAEALSERR